jgi:copper(I)-binding protein
MKTNRITVIAAVSAALAATSCRQAAEHRAASEETAVGELTVSDARLTLPAVRGNPGAAYFTVFNGSAKAALLTGAAVAGTERAELHQSAGGMARIERATVPAKGSLAFAPGGLHAMVFGIPANLAPGGRAKLTLTFADGRSVDAEAAVVGPGMAGMDHGAMH